MLIDNIIRYYENKPPIIEHEIHRKFIETQTEIGWRHLSRGRISKDIIDIIHQDFKKKQPPNKMNATRWIKKFINIILNTHTDEWREYCLRKTTTKEDNSYLQPQIERLQQASQNFDIPHQTR